MSIILTSLNTLDVTMIGKISELIETYGFSISLETPDTIVYTCDLPKVTEPVIAELPPEPIELPATPIAAELPIEITTSDSETQNNSPIILPDVIIKSLYRVNGILCTFDSSLDKSVLKCQNPMTEKRINGFSIFGIGNESYKYPTSSEGGILVGVECGDLSFDINLTLDNVSESNIEEIIIGQKDRHLISSLI